MGQHWSCHSFWSLETAVKSSSSWCLLSSIPQALDPVVPHVWLLDLLYGDTQHWGSPALLGLVCLRSLALDYPLKHFW